MGGKWGVRSGGRKILATFFQPALRHFFRRQAPPLAAPPLAVGGKSDENFSHFFRGNRGDAAREPGRPR